MGKFLKTAMSTVAAFGPRSELRSAVPIVPSAAGANAAVLNHCWTGSALVGRVASPTRSPLSWPTAVRDRSVPLLTVKGSPLRSTRMPLTCQSFSSALVTPVADVLFGRSYTTDRLNLCRMSKSAYE